MDLVVISGNCQGNLLREVIAAIFPQVQVSLIDSEGLNDDVAVASTQRMIADADWWIRGSRSFVDV